MPTFSDQIRENQIILIASIAVSQANVGSRRSHRALLDTGAQMTMVSGRVWCKRSACSRSGTHKSFP